jgi:hypothetical protein
VGIRSKGLLAMNFSEASDGPFQSQSRFKSDSGFSYEKVFKFAFGSWFIPYMKQIQSQMDKEKFIKMLEIAGNNFYCSSVKPGFDRIRNKNVRSLIENFWEPTIKSKLWGTCLNIKILQKKETQGKVKISECLVAKTFREHNAAEIGYAAICNADFAVAHTFNPKIRLTRNECLMKGHRCCLFEYSLQT